MVGEKLTKFTQATLNRSWSKSLFWSKNHRLEFSGDFLETLVELPQVQLNIRYNGGEPVTTNVPVGYFANCRVDGRALEAGQQLNVRDDSVPSCVTRGMQQYAKDLQGALRKAMTQLQSTSDAVSQESNGLLSLDVSSLTAGLTDALDPIVGEEGLLDISNLLNTLQPITRDLSNTVLAVERVLEGVEQQLVGLTNDLEVLLGGVVGLIGGGVEGLGNTVQRVGGLVGTLGSGVISSGQALTSGILGAGQSLTAGLFDTGSALTTGLAGTLDDITRLLGQPQSSSS